MYRIASSTFSRTFVRSSQVHRHRREILQVRHRSSGYDGGNVGGGDSKAVIAAAVGCTAGTLGSLAGIGGSLFVIPGLIRFAGLSQLEAAGCSLVGVSAISLTGSLSYAYAESIDWTIATTLAVSAAVSSPFGAVLSSRVNRSVLRRTMGVFCLLMATSMPLRNEIMKRRTEKMGSEKSSAETAPESQPRITRFVSDKTLSFALAGSSIGFTSGLMGIGGGGLFTAAIAVLTDLPMKVVIGTSLTSMVPPSLVAAVAYMRMGQIRRAIVPPLLAGSVLGSACGSRIALHLPENVLQVGIGIVLSILGIRLLRSPLKKVR